MVSMSFLISSNLASSALAERRVDQFLDHVADAMSIVASHALLAAGVLLSIVLFFRLYASISKRVHLKRVEVLKNEINRQRYQEAVERAARESQFAGQPKFGRFIS